MFLGSRWQAGLDWLLPCYCAGCGKQRVYPQAPICYTCLSDLWESTYDLHTQRTLEQQFWGRIPLRSVIIPFPLRTGSVLQQALHQLKYHHRPGIRKFLGKIAARQWSTCDPTPSFDALMPLPLHPAKKRIRGYNQAESVCQGIHEATGIPIWRNLVQSKRFTETQTNKDRGERWTNMQETFALCDTELATSKHLLLVDDVLTTGATLEACGQVLLQLPNIELSFFAVGRTEIG